MKSFVCKNCGKKVSLDAVGTRHRNHCPYCLWSLHIDRETVGDRKGSCHGLMKPIGLTFKKKIIDKYGKKKQGEIMIVHQCQSCGKETKNRIAGDDNTGIIMSLCQEKDKAEVKKQLFGK